MEGPVNIPVLPDGELFTLNLRAAAAANPLTLKVFLEEIDPEKPQFSAYLSVGDQAAVDVTADREADRSRVRVVGDTVIIEGRCAGDCNGDNSVTINEIISCVRIALGNDPLSNCLACDGNNDGMVTIPDLISAVRNLLNGCPQ